MGWGAGEQWSVGGLGWGAEEQWSIGGLDWGGRGAMVHERTGLGGEVKWAMGGMDLGAEEQWEGRKSKKVLFLPWNSLRRNLLGEW